MYCSQCGAEINQACRFCPECGAKQMMIGSIDPETDKQRTDVIRAGTRQTIQKAGDRKIIDEADSMEPSVMDAEALKYVDFIISRVFPSCTDISDLVFHISNGGNSVLKRNVMSANRMDLLVLLKGFNYYCTVSEGTNLESVNKNLFEMTLSELRNRNNIL